MKDFTKVLEIAHAFIKTTEQERMHFKTEWMVAMQLSNILDMR